MADDWTAIGEADARPYKEVYKTDHERETAAQLQEVKEVNERLQQQLAVQKEEAESLRKELHTFTGAVKQLSQEVSALKDMHNRLEEKNNRLQEKRKNRLQEARRRLREAVRGCEGLREAREALRGD